MYLPMFPFCPCFQREFGFHPVASEVAPAKTVLVHVSIFQIQTKI